MAKIEFGVAAADRTIGTVKDLYPCRFADYDSAKAYANTFGDCFPTVFCIVNDKYVFNCERCATLNRPYKIYKIESHDWGQTTTSVWWDNFITEPEKYFSFAEII